jgi:hypothetical protein
VTGEWSESSTKPGKSEGFPVTATGSERFIGCMITLIRDGGWSMFVILAFGLAALLTAASYAIRPDAVREGFLQWMSRAVLWAIFCGIASDFATVCHYVAHDSSLTGDQLARIVLEGVGESMSPAIVGFAFLALVALLTAVGRRRIDASRL